jgi:hypothetical protein
LDKVILREDEIHEWQPKVDFLAGQIQVEEARFDPDNQDELFRKVFFFPTLFLILILIYFAPVTPLGIDTLSRSGEEEPTDGIQYLETRETPTPTRK